LSRALLLIAGLSIPGAVVAFALLAVPSHAAAPASPCPPGFAGQLTNISRPIVPIGATVIRGFTVPDHTVSGMQLSAPPEYSAQQIPARNAFGLRFKAPHAGPFDVQGSWTEPYNSGTCNATGTATLTAAQGSPVVVKPPPTTFGGRQYGNPVIWSWKCVQDTDATPLAVVLRWEVGPQLKLGNRGGKPPYKFSRRAKTFSVTAGDPCDPRQGGIVQKRLAKNARLKIIVVGNVESGGGNLLVKFGGEFRMPGKKGNLLPLHLGVTVKQSTRTLLDIKLCAWEQNTYEIAKGKRVGCWY